MATKNQEPEKEEKKNGAEKPVSIWGAPFTDVLAALLKTKPMSKDKPKSSNKNKEGEAC